MQSEKQADGATVWTAEGMGGRSLARINDCRLENLQGDMRSTVYITGEADTWFSIPAVCRLMGKRIKGYVTGDGDGNLVLGEAISGDARTNHYAAFDAKAEGFIDALLAGSRVAA